ncbi:hypothetical protein EYF80_038122 [Liparis tanakae]|uniref:Uncharacterized protein n=1 Tax=Liparis tanakae TaxID=230148 RepID=A0A4Z2GEK9_9TELE|nr:hypothetical protein EYF80_038122 [Liparis tanakae]
MSRLLRQEGVEVGELWNRSCLVRAASVFSREPDISSRHRNTTRTRRGTLAVFLGPPGSLLCCADRLGNQGHRRDFHRHEMPLHTEL